MFRSRQLIVLIHGDTVENVMKIHCTDYRRIFQPLVTRCIATRYTLSVTLLLIQILAAIAVEL